MVELPSLPADVSRLLGLESEKLKEHYGFHTGEHVHWPNSWDRLNHTCEYAGDLFAVRADAYFRVWPATGELLEFFGWLDRIRKDVIDELRASWDGRMAWFDQAFLPELEKALGTEVGVWRDKAYDAAVAQLPADDPDRKRFMDYLSKDHEARANLDTEYEEEEEEGRPHDPQKAIEFIVSQFSLSCEAALPGIRDIASASKFEREFTAVVKGTLQWFVEGLKRERPNEADHLERELWPVLNRRLLIVLSKARARAWASLRDVGGSESASACAGPQPEPESHAAPPQPDLAGQPVPAGATETPKGKRGRPPIPDEKKDAAQAVKDQGGSNRDAARKLYDVSHVTDQQKRSVSTILREYRKKKSKQSPSIQSTAESQ